MPPRRVVLGKSLTFVGSQFPYLQIRITQNPLHDVVQIELFNPSKLI